MTAVPTLHKCLKHLAEHLPLRSSAVNVSCGQVSDLCAVEPKGMDAHHHDTRKLGQMRMECWEVGGLDFSGLKGLGVLFPASRPLAGGCEKLAPFAAGLFLR